MKPLLSGLFGVLLAASLPSHGRSCDGFYIVAHMTNSLQSVDWAVRSGANAIEIDLDFQKNGDNNGFHHGGFCDCTAPWIGGVCRKIKCGTATRPAIKLIQHIATKQPGISLVIVDAKAKRIDPTPETLAYAGDRLATEIIRAFFDQGYRGRLILSVPQRTHLPMLKAAYKNVRDHAPHWLPRVAFTIDGERGSAREVVAALSELRPHVVYGTGISILGLDFTEAIGEAKLLGMPFTYIWTVDGRNTMNQYLDLPVRAIMTNRPDHLRDVISVRKQPPRLAKPEDSLTCS